MERSPLSDNETYRVIVLRKPGAEVLLAPRSAGFSLPEVTIPRWQRVPENLTAVVKRQWGEEVVCLFHPDTSTLGLDDNQIHYQVAEHWRHFGESEVPTRWVPVEDLRQNSFVYPSDYAVTQRSLAECDTWARDPVAGPFARLGWFKELCEWIEGVVAPRRLHLSGNFRQLNASPSFSLIRFETDGPAVWFKAVGGHNLREFPITLAVHRLFPQFFPVVLATRPEWHGWITKEFEGCALDTFTDTSFWRRAASALGELQAESCERTNQFLGVGCRDLRHSALLQLVDPFTEVVAELMKEQTKIPPAPLLRRDLLALATQIKDAITALAELEIPDALGHLDLNPGNVLTSAEQCVFLDWADAHVGPPFLTFEYLRAHVLRASNNTASLESAIAEAYAAQWTKRLTPETIAKGYDLSPLVAVFAYASGTELWRDANRISETHTAGYLRSLTRRMNNEARVLAEKTPARFSIYTS